MVLYFLQTRVWRSLVARLNGVQEAGGSTPLTRTKSCGNQLKSLVSAIFLLFCFGDRLEIFGLLRIDFLLQAVCEPPQVLQGNILIVAQHGGAGTARQLQLVFIRGRYPLHQGGEGAAAAVGEIGGV